MSFTFDQKFFFSVSIYLLIAVIFLNVQMGELFHLKFKLEYLIILFLTSFLLMTKNFNIHIMHLKNSAILLSGICFILFLLPIINSENHILSIIGFIKYLYILLLFIIGFLLIYYKIKVHNFIVLIFIFSTLQACLGTYQYILNEGSVWLTPNVIRPSGTLDNYLANYLLIGLLSGFTLLLQRNHNLIIIIALSLIVSVLFFFNSRIAYVFTIWIILILLFFTRKDKNILKKLPLIIGIIILLINTISFARYYHLSQRSNEILPQRSSNTASVRFELWQNAIDMSLDKPFGIGYKMFGTELHDNAKNDEHLFDLIQTFQLGTNIDAHSFFFTLLAEAGVLLTLIFFLPIIFIWIKTIFLQSSKNISSQFIKIWIVSGVPLLIIYDPMGMNLFWIALGAASCLIVYSKKGHL